MLPVIAIIGRPNVGKSTLFNYLTKTRDALVIDMPGVTRDRQYGEGRVGDREYIVVDTGGIAEPDDPEMSAMTDEQVKQAIQEADRLLFMVDAKDGLTAADQAIANTLRREYRDKVVLLVNKVDRVDANIALGEFHELGLGDPIAITATQGRGVTTMIQEQLDVLPIVARDEDNSGKGIKVAVIGRPNVGKSTLINRILGEDRVVVFDRPGTTRDSIEVPFEREGVRYTLIDTAGVRRKAKVREVVEKFSMIKSMQAIEASHVVVVVMSAHDDVYDQDLRLISIAAERGKALIIAVNKWDGMSDYERERFKTNFEKKVNFVDYARRYFISALHGTGVGKLYFAIDEAYQSTMCKVSTSMVTKALEAAQKTHQAPLVKGRRVKLRYAHIGSHNPLVVVIHGKQTSALPGSYKRFLSNFMRESFKLVGVPVIIKFKKDENPFAT
ncbi:MAG: ribosome biogenesis GTPase Der [Coxiella sp. (in: Bacteria)]|nr:MAG: ribosome biogenesis GTPase Der [Coxiella sp. (in: g-proteobacteria)]